MLFLRDSRSVPSYADDARYLGNQTVIRLEFVSNDQIELIDK